MSLSDAKEKAVLDWLFGTGATVSRPASYDLALSSTQPTDAGGNITPPPGGVGYARLNIVNNDANFPVIATPGNPKVNGQTFEFAEATGSWGAALGWWVLYDGGTENVAMWGTLTPAKTIAAGDVLRIVAGQMSITAD